MIGMQNFASRKDDFAKRYKAGGDQKEKSVSTGWMCFVIGRKNEF
jgi:hypothetical protein